MDKNLRKDKNPLTVILFIYLFFLQTRLCHQTEQRKAWVSKEALQSLIIREEEAPRGSCSFHFNPSSTVCTGPSGDRCGLMKRPFEWMVLCRAMRGIDSRRKRERQREVGQKAP